MAFDDPLAFGVVDPECGNSYAAIINQAWHPSDADQPPPCARADYRTQPGGLEIEREAIPTGSAPTVDEHCLGALMSDAGPGPIFAIAYAPIVNHFSTEHFDEAVRDLTPA